MYRSIPARAGEPPVAGPAHSTTEVYPRACGGTAGGRSGTLDYRGLSPRVRGNRSHLRRVTGPGRSIPARAGEPGQSQAYPRRRRVYPRACGGTHRHSLPTTRDLGLSPRVRGNRRYGGLNGRRNRSIPARAGEPRPCLNCYVVGQVYPRACGGTGRRMVEGRIDQGLSPRVRGNPQGPTIGP